MAPERSQQMRHSGRKPLIQPALPLLPGVARKKATVVSPQPPPPTAQPTISELPESTKPDPEAEESPDRNHTADSYHAPEVLIESSAVPAADSYDEIITATNDLEQTAEPVEGRDEHGQTGGAESDTVLPEQQEPIGNHIGHQFLADEPVSVASYPNATFDSSEEISSATSRASLHADDILQEESTVAAGTSDEPSSLPTEIDGKPATPLPYSRESTPQETLAESAKYASASDEGYASRDHTGHNSATSPQSRQLNGIESTLLQYPAPESPAFVSLSDHLLQLSNTKAWADFAIVINNKLPQPVICYAHSMMLIRSPRLRKQMERQGVTPNNTLTLPSPIAIMPHAFEAALRFLYSDAVLTAEALFPRQMTPDTQQARPAILPYILSYWVSGLLLGIDHVVSRASKLLGEAMDWDIVETVFKEAETLALSIDADFLDSDVEWPNLVTQWRSIALGFCATRVDPRQISLDTASMSLLRSRFGSLEQSRGKHNPVLASMVFGSMPPSADMPPASPQAETFQTSPKPDMALSSILLNADFHDLVLWARQMKTAWGDAGERLLTDIVQEREGRRLRIIQDHAVPNKQRMANSAIWDVVGWREMVHNGELSRERVGFLIPTHR